MLSMSLSGNILYKVKYGSMRHKLQKATTLQLQEYIKSLLNKITVLRGQRTQEPHHAGSQTRLIHTSISGIFQDYEKTITLRSFLLYFIPIEFVWIRFALFSSSLRKVRN